MKKKIHKNFKILAIIPARGGSKGIPQKNIKSLNNKPLIYYSINNALSSNYNLETYITSDSSAILTIAKEMGAKTIKRSDNISDDLTTLDPVIYDAWKKISFYENKNYDYVITMQPTSPLLKVKSLDQAIKKITSNNSIDTIISAKNDIHLTWGKKNNKFYPNFKKRENRQLLPKVFKETGAFLITKSKFLRPNNRIGKNVELYFPRDFEENIDIDNFHDLKICEFYLRNKKILFVVAGNKKIGLGHVYNLLQLATEMNNHNITFLVDKKSKMAFDKIKSYNYPVLKQSNKNILDDIKKINPDIIVNDILDTKKSYILKLKKISSKVINFEDLGEGSKYTDLTINAIYSKDPNFPKSYFGFKYFMLRDEFIYKRHVKIKKVVKKILISFGGVDPNNFTFKVLSSIYEYCELKNIKILIIAGFGYNNFNSLNSFKNIEVLKNVQNISDYMASADIIFSSAGRTLYEIASLAVPSIILCQNSRETKHTFCSIKNGFINLGLGKNISKNIILNTLIDIIDNYKMRKSLHSSMLKIDLKSGKKKVIQLINKKIDYENF